MSENPVQTTRNIEGKILIPLSLRRVVLTRFNLEDGMRSKGHDAYQQIYENKENINNFFGSCAALMESLEDTVGEDRVSSSEDSERTNKEANKMKLISPIKILNDYLDNPRNLDREEMHNMDLDSVVKLGKDTLNKVENKYGDKLRKLFKNEIKAILKTSMDNVREGNRREAYKALEILGGSIDSPDDYLFDDISGTEEDNISDLLEGVRDVSKETGLNPDKIEKRTKNILREYSASKKIDKRKSMYEELPEALVHMSTEGLTLGEIVEDNKEKYDVRQAERKLREGLGIKPNRTTFEDVLERYKLNIASETDEKQIDRYTKIVNKDKNKTAFMGKNPASIAAAIIKKTTNSLDEEIGTEKLSQKYNISEKSIEDRLEELNELEDDTTRTANTYYN